MSQPLSTSQSFSGPPLAGVFRPALMIGAASPLWGYFTGAAMTGMAWWWMTRWMAPQDFATFAERMAEPAMEALAEAVGGPVAEALVSDEIPALPVGGEAAPFSAAVLEAELIEDPELAGELAQQEAAPARARKPREAEAKAKPH
jgi:hypothetical protein